jgi:uncharacterized membrane protein (UPF0127 family)
MDGRIPRALAAALLLVACKGGSPSPASADQGEAPPPTRAAPAKPRPEAQSGEAPATAPKVVLTTPAGESHTVAVELARTDMERQRGLMFREHMGEDQGMLFLMPDEQPHRFWMKNTYIPLDMIWIGSDLVVRGVTENARPLTLALRGIDAPSLYVLEVNAHYAKAHGIVPGTRIELRGVPLPAAAGPQRGTAN